jgi:hypothetical protein
MRKFMWAILAVLVITFGAPYANADTTESFDFSGHLALEFNGNGTVTGTFTLDLSTASVTAFDFAVPRFMTAVDASDGYIAFLRTFTNNSTDFVWLEFSQNANTLNLFFQTDLASFSGTVTLFNQLVITPAEEQKGSGIQCASCIFPDTHPVPFVYGSATQVVTAPEPASLQLLGSGFLGVAAIKRRRRSQRRSQQ